MSYVERIERLTYQSPKRKTFDLEFDDLARNIQRKTAINEFPYQNIANVQDLGMANLKIPIRCYISGSDYDLEADRFFKALNEQGYGVLDHPRWGSIDVIPINITQSESFVDGLGRAIFEIEFIEYYPDATKFPESLYSKIKNFINDVTGAIDNIFQLVDSILTLETELRRIVRTARRIVGSTISEVKRVETRFKGISTRWKEDTKNNFVSSTFDAANKFRVGGREKQDLFNKNLRVFQEYIQENPDLIINEAVKQLNTLARTEQDPNIKVSQIAESYTNTINFIESKFDDENMNDFEANINGYNAIAFTLAMTEKLINGNYITRSESILIIDMLSERRERLKIIYDKVIQKNGNLDYDILLQVYNAISLSQRQILNQSLQLPTEKNIILDKDTSPIEMVYSITGNIDRLDELISYNNLQGKNILVIPKGTSIRFY
jgi:hypothetical protein